MRKMSNVFRLSNVAKNLPSTLHNVILIIKYNMLKQEIIQFELKNQIRV